jgi:hypothetical protein
VTLRTPPKGELFADFHGALSAEGVIGADPTVGPFGAFPMFPWQQMFPMMGMMQAMTQSVPIQPTAGVTHTQSVKPLARGAPPSSDPPEYENTIEYPMISDFLVTLNNKYPKCALVAYHNNFELMDYYYIDELVQMAEEDLTGTDFCMTSGNAKFLLREAREEVRRLERAAKRARN